MEPDVRGPDSGLCAVETDAAPWAFEYVQLTKQAYGELVMQTNYWKAQHGRAVGRSHWREDRYRRINRQLKEQAGQREAALRAELDLAQAKVRELQQRVFGRKSERRTGGSEQQARTASTRARGQQPGARGHARTMQTNMPERVEVIALDSPPVPQLRLGPQALPRHSGQRGRRDRGPDLSARDPSAPLPSHVQLRLRARPSWLRQHHRA